MKSRNNVIIVIGVVLAVMGAGVAVAYLKGNDGGSGGTKSVVVATGPVAAGTPVANAGLAVKKVDADAVPPNAVTSTAVLNGQVALVALSANQVVTPVMFGVQGVATAGGVVLPAGKKGIGVELGFAPGGLRYVVPGNKIDIYASQKIGDGLVRTTVILKGIEVIATTPGAGTGAPTAVAAGPGNLDFLLAVTESDALKIVNAQATAQSLYFVLAETRK